MLGKKLTFGLFVKVYAREMQKFFQIVYLAKVWAPKVSYL